MVDARQEAPVAPLLVVEARKETSFENGAVAFERRKRDRDSAGLKSERAGKRRWRDRSEALESATQDLDQCLFARPFYSRLIGWRRDLRLEPRLRPYRAELTKPLGRNPQRHMPCVHKRDTPVARQRIEPFAPSWLSADFCLCQTAEPEQRVVQLLGIDGIGPGLGLNLGDRLGVQPAKVRRALRVAPPPRHNRLRSPFLKGRVVEKGVGSRRQRLQCERRRLRQIA